MYTCDACRRDTSSPDNLIRVWSNMGDTDYAILICSDCLEGEFEAYYTLAESDPTWVYGAERMVKNG